MLGLLCIIFGGGIGFALGATSSTDEKTSLKSALVGAGVGFFFCFLLNGMY